MSESGVLHLEGGGRIRFFDEGALLFDPVTWATHVLNEDAAALARAICDRPGRVSHSEAVAIARDELGWDVDDPSVLQTLRILVDAAFVRPDGDD